MGEFFKYEWKCNNFWCRNKLTGCVGYDEETFKQKVVFFCPQCNNSKSIVMKISPFVDKKTIEKIKAPHKICEKCKNTMIDLDYDTDVVCPECHKGRLKISKTELLFLT